MRTVTVSITQADIDGNGQTRRFCQHPIHAAMGRAGVGGYYPEIVNVGGLIEFPEHARNFFYAWNVGHPVAPLTFDLQIPD